MKFIVQRSSDPGSGNSPCDGAIKQKIKFASRAQIGPRIDQFDDVWTIEIESLESLIMDFINREDSVIIYEPFAYELPTIEIYDENPDY